LQENQKYGILRLMKTTLEIPDELYRQAKVHAAQENRKMKDIVSEGLQMVLGVTQKVASRVTKPPVTIHPTHAGTALNSDRMAEIVKLADAWGVSPDEALVRLTQTARAANAAREKSLGIMEEIERNPPYPPGRVREMIDEANRLRKETWD